VAEPVVITPMSATDAASVLAIYADGIAAGDATFETTVPDWPTFDAARRPDHRWVAREPDGRVLGWVAISPTSGRPAYVGVVEHSVYVASAARGRGIGGLLLRRLIDSTEAADIWTIQSGIFPENDASLALHARAGFRVVGTRERVAQHHGRWRDVILVERRSRVAGR
jgi:phosphinothricin acetyltransferase